MGASSAVASYARASSFVALVASCNWLTTASGNGPQHWAFGNRDGLLFRKATFNISDYMCRMHAVDSKDCREFDVLNIQYTYPSRVNMADRIRGRRVIGLATRP